MNLKKIKIAYFHQDGLITGSAISLSYYIKELNKSKFFPIVILAKDGPVRSLFEKCGAIVEVFFFHTFWTFPGPRFLSRDFIFQLNSLKINKRLFDYVKNYIKPDIIHINDKASISVGISLKRLNIPIVQHIRSSYNSTRTVVNSFISSKFINMYADKLIVISEDELDFFERNKNYEIINNPVDLKKLKKIKSKRSLQKKI